MHPPRVRKSGRRSTSIYAGGGFSSSDGEGEGAAAARRAALEADIGFLMDMGFSRSKAREALADAEGNLEEAVTFLVSHCV